jgi:hypothetical protein
MPDDDDKKQTRDPDNPFPLTDRLKKIRQELRKDQMKSGAKRQAIIEKWRDRYSELSDGVKLDLEKLTGVRMDSYESHREAYDLIVGEEGEERIIDTLSALIKTREDRTEFTPDVVERIAATC